MSNTSDLEVKETKEDAIPTQEPEVKQDNNNEQLEQLKKEMGEQQKQIAILTKDKKELRAMINSISPEEPAKNVDTLIMEFMEGNI